MRDSLVARSIANRSRSSPPVTESGFSISHFPNITMLSAVHTIEDRQKPLALPQSSQKQQSLQKIHTILTGWYRHGALSISIDGVPAFNTADQCIAMLERSRLSEIQRVHRLLTGNRDEKAIVEPSYIS